MSKGLEKLLDRIKAEPSTTLVSRYLALAAEIPTEPDKTNALLNLAEALLSPRPEQALAIAHMAYQADPQHQRALDLMISALEARGRFGKAEVLKRERDKISDVNFAKTEHLSSNPDSAEAEPSTHAATSGSSAPLPPFEMQVAATPAPSDGEVSPFRLKAASVPVMSDSLEAAQRMAATTHVQPPLERVPDIDAATFAALAELFPPDARLPAYGGAAVEMSAASAPGEKLAAQQKKVSPVIPPNVRTSIAASPRTASIVAQASRQESSRHHESGKEVFKDAFAELPATLPGESSVGSQARPFEGIHVHVHLHGRAADVFDATHGDAHSAASTAASLVPGANVENFAGNDATTIAETPDSEVFWQRLAAELLRRVDRVELDLAPPAAVIPSSGTRLPECATHLTAAFRRLASSSPDGAATCAAHDLIRALEADESLVPIFERVGWHRHDAGFFGLYLDALLAAGDARQALQQIRATLQTHPRLAWAQVAARRLPHIAAHQGVQPYMWHEDLGVPALIAVLARRPEPRLKAIALC